MATKYECGTTAAEKSSKGIPTVKKDRGLLAGIKETLQYADNGINKTIDETVKNKILRKIFKSKPVKTVGSVAGVVASHAVWGAGMAIGGSAGGPFALVGLGGMAVCSMGIIHNVSDMKLVKTLGHAFKNAAKTVVTELSPDAKKIRDKVGRFVAALTEKDVPMTIRHYNSKSGKMEETKIQNSIPQRFIRAWHAANCSGGK